MIFNTLINWSYMLRFFLFNNLSVRLFLSFCILLSGKYHVSSSNFVSYNANIFIKTSVLICFRSLMFQFCLNCLRPVKNVHPCLTCSGVAFCSSACREAASASFHKYQCQLNLYTYRQNDTEDAFNIFMVLQTLWQKPVSFFFENLTTESIELVGEVDLEYRRLWNMVSNRNNRPNKIFLKIDTISVFFFTMKQDDFVHEVLRT